jgi:hypothetical protein
MHSWPSNRATPAPADPSYVAFALVRAGANGAIKRIVVPREIAGYGEIPRGHGGGRIVVPSPQIGADGGQGVAVEPAPAMGGNEGGGGSALPFVRERQSCVRPRPKCCNWSELRTRYVRFHVTGSGEGGGKGPKRDLAAVLSHQLRTT